jgi:hemoglobin
MSEPPSQSTLYEAVGGEPTFRRLVGGFYRRVAEDPVLRPLYPDDELADAEQRLLGFLVQYWGGPDTYSQQRGHPRLRRRHAPFAIGAAQRDAWLRNMRAALDDVGLAPAHDAAVWEHLHRAAFMLQNVPDDPPGPDQG